MVSDDNDKPSSVDLSGDRLETLVGLGVTAAALVAVAVLDEVKTALAILVFLALAFSAAVLIVSVVTRSLERGLTAVTRWTFGFLGRWLPL